MNRAAHGLSPFCLLFFPCLVLFLSLNLPLQAGPPVKIACVGASITEGAGLEDPEHNSWPGQLQQLMGVNYQVRNFGVSGATLLRKGDLSYWNTAAYQSALQSIPGIVVIDLGGNDSKAINRIYLDEYIADYKAMIRSFTQLPSHPRVILLLPLPSFVKDSMQIWDPVIVLKIIPLIQQVAFEENLEVLDMHSLFTDRVADMKDKIHPDRKGAATIAKRIAETLTQKSDSGFAIIPKIQQPVKIVSFYGYSCAELTMMGRACKIVTPKKSAKGHPWVWRARFWGHEPQTDIALLERGFHIVYCEVAELFGNPEAINRWNAWYEFLHGAGLAKKAVMEGMSRGAVYVFNWAAVNGDKVACVYVDNPVLDLKSWPGGLGRQAPAEKEKEQLNAAYQLKTTADLRKFTGSPVDKVPAIVKGGYPILILCADADEAVPPEENTLLFEQRVKSLNGKITVMHKPGFGHHPHSLPDPGPIVGFILKEAGTD